MTSKAETNLSEEEDDEDDEDNIFVDGGLDSSAASDQLNKEMADSRQNSDKDLVAQIQFLDDEATTAINSDSRTLLNLNQSTKKVSVSLEDKRSDVTSESSHVLYDEMSINSSLESIDGSHIQDIPPLFVNLSCSVKEGVNVRSQSVRSLPTCLGELIDCLEDPVSDIDLSGLSITLDIICLTLPVDSDSEPCRKRSERTISVGSMPSPVGTPPQEADIYQHLQSDGSESASVYPLGSLSMDPLSILPAAQNKVVKDAAEQIKWLMKDEIASAKRLISPINATTLDMVAIHVTGSTAKATCKAEKVPLHFVFGAEHSRDKFIEEFGRMDKTCFENLELIGFSIMKEDNYYYLIRDESLYMFTPTTRLLQDAAVALSRENLLNHDLELSSMNLVSTELGLDQSQNSTEFSLDQSQNSTELGLDQSQSSSEIKPLRINEMDNPKRTTEELAKNDRESVINIKNENEIGTDIAKKEVCMLEMTEQIDKESNTETNYINPVEDNSSETSIQVLSEECGGDLAHEPELQEEDTSNAQEKDETHCEQNDNKLKENPVDSELNALRDKLHSDSANDVIKSSNTTAEVSEMSGEQEFSESEVVLIPPSSIPSRLQEEIMHPGTPAGTNLPASPSVTSTISSEVGVEAPDSLTSSGGSKHHRRQPSVFSTVSSGLTSVNASRVSLNDDEKELALMKKLSCLPSVNISRVSLNEEAYDGGSSDNDSDGRLMSLTDTEQFQSRMLNFG
uniref:Uncharacterized protein LOC102802249 n=1 Tax=Saccoglossus kowalevskii TaxID=10224 RepID=A0ABM0LXU7_SACKO|nr:PREDICTED: uncharacterized protein LOC102802249 [Saccoglossus kowalevskii]